MMQFNHNEQVEPTANAHRASPWLDGVNIQQTQWSGRLLQVDKGRGRGKGSKGQPGSLRTWWGETWKPEGKGQPGQGYSARGDQWGQGRGLVNRAPAVAPAVAFGQVTQPWGGRGRGWDRGVPLDMVPCRSSPPRSPPWAEGPASSGSKGGGAKGKGKGKAMGVGPVTQAVLQQGTSRGGESWGWQRWTGRVVLPGVQTGYHTGQVRLGVGNYWETLRGSAKGKGKAVCPSWQRVWGTDEEPSAMFRNSLEYVQCKGRNTAPSGMGSHSAFRGGLVCWRLVFGV